jgi:hypothetical protein
VSRIVRCPPSKATRARNTPFIANIAPPYATCAWTARRAAVSESRLVGRYTTCGSVVLYQDIQIRYTGIVILRMHVPVQDTQVILHGVSALQHLDGLRISLQEKAGDA